MPTEKYVLGTPTVILSTEADSLADNSQVLGSNYNNTQGGGAGDGFTLCDVELAVSFDSAPTANSGIAVWFLSTMDGTTFEDGDGATQPGRRPDLVFALRPVAGVQRTTERNIWLPAGIFKTLLRNDGTGQPLSASGTAVTIRPCAFGSFS